MTIFVAVTHPASYPARQSFIAQCFILVAGNVLGQDDNNLYYRGV